MAVKLKEKKWIKVEDYFNFNSYALAAGVGQNYDLISERVPQNLVLRIIGVETYAGVYADWSKIEWDFRINGIGQPPLSKRTDQIGAPGNPAKIPAQILETGGGKLFAVNINNLDAALGHAGGVVLNGEWGYYERS